jgi:hypothetical protein
MKPAGELTTTQLPYLPRSSFFSFDAIRSVRSTDYHITRGPASPFYNAEAAQVQVLSGQYRNTEPCVSLGRIRTYLKTMELSRDTFQYLWGRQADPKQGPIL